MIRNVSEHYAEHLGPIYSWMVGGVELAAARGATELDALNLSSSKSSLALDLGAGIGMHAIPLARRGYTVVAIDTEVSLLKELKAHVKDLPVRTVVADLTKFRDQLDRAPDLILCMGDTLTHLPHAESVMLLFSDIASALSSGGLFVCTFRNYTEEPTPEGRIILVKSAADRILTCFLEYDDSSVTVHDILHERDVSEWRMRVSSYRKLRLAPSWVCGTLERCGFEVADKSTPGGMICVTARKREKRRMENYFLGRNQPQNFS